PPLLHSAFEPRTSNFSSPDPFSPRRTDVRSILPYLRSAKVCRPHAAFQQLARVRTDIVPMLDDLGSDAELRIRIEGDDVRVAAIFDGALAIADPGDRRGAGAHQT